MVSWEALGRLKEGWKLATKGFEIEPSWLSGIGVFPLSLNLCGIGLLNMKIILLIGWRKAYTEICGKIFHLSFPLSGFVHCSVGDGRLIFGKILGWETVLFLLLFHIFIIRFPSKII